MARQGRVRQGKEITISKRDRRQKMSEIDWSKEKEALRKGETKDWWKPTPGQHKIKILSEGEEYVV